MDNPYKILGVSENATDDEIKSAYRKLAKKYHPDNYVNNPLADIAEQKMKEINEAYDAINKLRQKGRGSGSTSTNSNSQSGYSSYSSGNYYSSNGSTSQFYSVRVYLQQKMVNNAEQILDSTPANNRTAEWHFLKGICAYMRGWNEQATNYFTTACNMDPSNGEYKAAYQNITRQQTYNYGGYADQTYSNSSQCDCCDICSALICMDCLCSCCR